MSIRGLVLLALLPACARATDDASTHPGASEACDAIDEECTATSDDCGGTSKWVDADGDGYGDPLRQVATCRTDGYADNDGDCDDENSSIHPSAHDTCGDAVDADCDGVEPPCRTLGVLGPPGTPVLDEASVSEFGAIVAIEPMSRLILTIENADDASGGMGTLVDMTYNSGNWTAGSRWVQSMDGHLGGYISPVGALEGLGGADFVTGGDPTWLFSLACNDICTASDALASFHFPASAATGPGDLDEDGSDDLVLGRYSHGSSHDIGYVYVFAGPLSGPYTEDEAVATWVGTQPSDRFGWSLASGDFDADGRPDVAVGDWEVVDPDAGGVRYPIGGVWLITEPGNGIIGVGDVAAAHWFGHYLDEVASDTLDAAGDVDGDGYVDVIAGGRTTFPYDSGSDGWEQDVVATLIPGDVTGEHDMELDADARIRITDPHDTSGVSVTSAGDLDNDGYDDIAIGTYAHEGPDGNYGGSVFVFYGPVEGAVTLEDADLWLYDDEPMAQLGRSIDGGTDLDGDGFDDLAMGAPYGGDHGEVWILFGGGS